jgi:hypothetical protein
VVSTIDILLIVESTLADAEDSRREPRVFLDDLFYFFDGFWIMSYCLLEYVFMVT